MPAIETICNEALDLIGYKRHIGNIYEGTLAARVALNAWAETRDEILIMQPWYFARTYKPLVSSDLPPQSPWRFEYIYPDDCVKLLMVKPLSVPVDSQPIRWLERFDTKRTILANINNAVGVYTGRVLDPNTWPADYTEVLVQMLARKFASNFGQEEMHDSRRRRKSGADDSRQPE